MSSLRAITLEKKITPALARNEFITGYYGLFFLIRSLRANEVNTDYYGLFRGEGGSRPEAKTMKNAS